MDIRELDVKIKEFYGEEYNFLKMKFINQNQTIYILKPGMEIETTKIIGSDYFKNLDREGKIALNKKEEDEINEKCLILDLNEFLEILK